MFWWGKLILAVLGFYRGGPAGLVFGLAVGHMLDVAVRRWWRRRRQPGLTAEDQQRFFIGIFEFMGHLAKAKGRVDQTDIDFARVVMRRLGLNTDHSHQAQQAFKRGKSPDFDLRALLSDLQPRLRKQPPLALIFLETQIEAAYADRRLGPTDKELLNELCSAFGISRLQLEKCKHQVRARLARERHQRGPGQPEPAMSLHEAREVLGVETGASAADVKQAYRRAMSRHHPDKLVARGLPESMQRLATAKVQQLQTAYEVLSTEAKKTRVK